MAQEHGELAERDAADIRSDIDRTRARIVATVDAIEARLRPTHLMSEARQTITDAATRRVQTMRLHPVQTMLVALGLLVIAGEVLRRRRSVADA